MGFERLLLHGLTFTGSLTLWLSNVVLQSSLRRRIAELSGGIWLNNKHLAPRHVANNSLCNITSVLVRPHYVQSLKSKYTCYPFPTSEPHLHGLA